MAGDIARRTRAQPTGEGGSPPKTRYVIVIRYKDHDLRCVPGLCGMRLVCQARETREQKPVLKEYVVKVD